MSQLAPLPQLIVATVDWFCPKVPTHEVAHAIRQTMTDWDFPQPWLDHRVPTLADIDGLGHTNNAIYVQWCEQIAWAHSASLGLALADYQRLDRAMAIRRGEYDYLLPTHEGIALTLATWLTDSDGKLQMQRRFQLRRDSDGATVMRGRWELVCIELSSGRPRRMPEDFRSAYLKALTVIPAA
jgi:acyl-CoA thioester hydrolase